MSRRLSAAACAALLITASAEAQSLLNQFEGVSAADLAGYATAGGADFDQDGWDDLLIGVPGHDVGPVDDVGAAYVISGRDGSTLYSCFGDGADADFGFAVGLAGDVDADGVEDFIVGAPRAEQLGNGRPGLARVFSGQNGSELFTVYGVADGDRFGSAVGGGLVRDSDAHDEFVVGAPEAVSAFHGDVRGAVYLFDGLTGALARTYGTIYGPGAEYGTSLWCRSDLDGDGLRDLIVGAPGGGSTGGGEVALISGDTFGTLSPTIDLEGFAPGDEFGFSVGAADLDGDGAAEVLVGAPGDSSVAPNGGRVGVYVVATESWAGFYYGADSESLGASVAGLGDVDGDGGDDLVVAAMGVLLGTPGYALVIDSDGNELFRVEGTGSGESFVTYVASAGDLNRDGVGDLAVSTPFAATAAGRVQVLSGGGAGIVTYCTAGVSASGCQASIDAIGTPSVTATSGFGLGATGVEGSKNGIFFYGANGRQANPWGNGTSFQCVVPPVKRGGLIDGGGTNGQCDGQFIMDLNARWCATCPKAHHNPGAGAVVQAQLWYRDPLNTSNQTTSLSDAVEFVVQP